MRPGEQATPLTFTSSPTYTLGVELEFQTLDTKSLNLAPLATVLLARISHQAAI